MSRLRPRRGTIARTATQSSSCSDETVGDSSPGVSAQARSTRRLGAVVVEHDVGARRDDSRRCAAAAPRCAWSSPRPSRRMRTASLTAGSARRRPQGPAGAGWCPVSTTSAMTSATPSVIAVSTAPSRRTTSADSPRSARCRADEARVLVATRLPVDVARRWRPDPACAAYRNVDAPKPSGMTSTAPEPGVEQQVAAGDAGVDGARADVDGDVARTQVEELDVVLGVGDDELLAVAARAVARLAQHLDGRSDREPLLGTAIRSMAVEVLRGGSRRRRARCPWRA